MKIVILDGYTVNPGDLSWDALSTFGTVDIYDRSSAIETAARMAGAEAVFTNKVFIDRQLISTNPQLKYIGVLATGYNVVDLGAAREAGITVTNIPSYGTDSVAQHVFAHILNITNQVALHARIVREGAWSKSKDFSFRVSPQTEIAGKTLGIIGFGQIGQRVAELGKAFGMNVIFQNRSVKNGIPSCFKQVTLEELLKQADVVSINCPLTDENREFINRRTLALMKTQAVLINSGRGPLIQEHDLAEALNEGKIAAAGLDVLSEEPPRQDNPLLKAKNCFVTPHIAWTTGEARQRLLTTAISNFEAYLHGKPQNVVNP
ncbi:MAG: D-2-hydroxyacid dehydrogenase [Prolixibacteraceae bacterium]